MADEEVKHKLQEFVNEIFYGVHSVEEAKALKERLDAFYLENNVTLEQRKIMVESGAGDMLGMML